MVLGAGTPCRLGSVYGAGPLGRFGLCRMETVPLVGLVWLGWSRCTLKAKLMELVGFV